MDTRGKPDRNLAVIRFRLTGKTYEECGKKFELSRERIHQICVEWGPRFALGVAKQMADDDAPVQKITDMLDRYVQHKCLPVNKVQDILHSALWEAGRFQELTLRSGFWLYRPDAMEAQMKHFMVRGADGFETIDATIYLHGVCGVFALALHDRLGHPIEALLDDSDLPMWGRLVHLYCPVKVLGQQGYADVRGITTSWDEFLEEYAELSNTWERRPVDPGELRKQLLMEMDKDTLGQFYRDAVRLIREMPWAFDGSLIK